MLAEKVALHDPVQCTPERCVHDIEGFVNGTINDFQRPTGARGPIILTLDERDELVCEGLAIMHKLAASYKPHLAGYEQGGWLSGYTARYLPRKLGDAWHRLHPEHHLRTQPDGRRKWEYGERAVSLEAVTADGPDRYALLMSQRERQSDIAGRLHRALFEKWTRKIEVIVRVGELLSEEASPADVAHILGLTSAQVQEAIGEITSCVDRIRGESE